MTPNAGYADPGSKLSKWFTMLFVQQKKLIMCKQAKKNKHPEADDEGIIEARNNP